MVSQKSPGNIALDGTGTVQNYDNNRSTDLGYVEIGYMIVEKEKTLGFFEIPECSFSSILQKMAAKQQISAWVQNDAYHSISDPERWKKTETYLKPKKILLIDRDGVINQKAVRGEYVSKWENFEWITETRKAMKELTQEGFQFIVITNQAGIARGMIDPGELKRIHQNMRKELQKDGIQILDIFFCPHHWDEKCFCRKPNPGMLFQASKEHLFRLDKTIFIGDDPRDCQTAWRAGCFSVFLGDKSELKNFKDDDQPEFIASGLANSLDFIRNFFHQSS
jgi:D-glycero-D-manno-heptose 1,7-bisphosphate phosphatase